MITWPREVILYYDLFNFRVLLDGRIPTLILFYFLHMTTTPKLPVYVDQQQPHLEKDTTWSQSMIIQKVLTVSRRTRVTSD